MTADPVNPNHRRCAGSRHRSRTPDGAASLAPSVIGEVARRGGVAVIAVVAAADADAVLQAGAHAFRFTVRELVRAPESGVRVKVPFPLVFAFRSSGRNDALRAAVRSAVRQVQSCW